MKITYETTLADYKAAFRLVDRKTFFRRYELIIWPAVALLSAFVDAGSDPRSEIYSVARVLFDYSALLSIGLPLVRVFSPYLGFWRNHGKARTIPNSTEITSEGVTDVMSGIRTTSLTWSSVKGFARDARVTLLYRRGFRFIFFPTSALSQDQHAELDELVSHHKIRRWS